LVYDNAVDVPFEDQWDLLRPLFQGAGPLTCFDWQHGPHRQGLGGLINWYLYKSTGWDVRAEAWAAVVILSLATISALVLSARLRGRMSWSDAAIPLLLLSPVQWETMLLTPNIAHTILPLLLLVLLSVAWTIRHTSGRTIAIGILGGLCLFTGFGICAMIASITLSGFLVLRIQTNQAVPNRVQSLKILLCLLCAGGLFSLGYRWSPAVPGWHFPVTPWWDYGRFAALMFTSLLGWRAITPASVTLGSSVLFVVLAVFVTATRSIWKCNSNNHILCVWGLTASSLVFIAMTAIGRLPVSLEAAFMWRYLSLVMPAILGCAIAAEKYASTRSAAMRCFVSTTWILVCAVIWCNLAPEKDAAATAQAKSRWVACYLMTHDLEAANRTSGFWVYSPAPASPIIAERLRWLEQHHLSFLRQQPSPNAR
jgi:hypothetical protein